VPPTGERCILCDCCSAGIKVGFKMLTKTNIENAIKVIVNTVLMQLCSIKKAPQDYTVVSKMVNDEDFSDEINGFHVQQHFKKRPESLSGIKCNSF
jgi:hypothetical protein